MFDGIDIDWEYPAAEGAAGNVVRPEDTRNFTLMLAELRRQLDALGRANHRHYLLTAAVPAGFDKIAKLEVGRIHRSLDWLNLLTYDFHGPWEATGPAQFHSNLFLRPDDPNPEGSPVRVSVDDVVNAYLRGGTPSRKIVIGTPFYGHGRRHHLLGLRRPGGATRQDQLRAGSGARRPDDVGAVIDDEQATLVRSIDQGLGRHGQPG